MCSCSFQGTSVAPSTHFSQVEPAAALKTLYISRSRLRGLRCIAQGIAKFNGSGIAFDVDTGLYSLTIQSL